MDQEKYTRREVDRSFRKFEDLERDVFSAVYQTWWENFLHLVDHCESDRVMRAITDPLKENPNVDADDWYINFVERGCIGPGYYRYTLPTNDTDRTALIYKFFLMISESGENTLDNFCDLAYSDSGSSIVDDRRVFNQEIVQKFTREMKYRINEIREDIGNNEIVHRSEMLVFQNFGNFQNVTGSIDQNNVSI